MRTYWETMWSFETDNFRVEWSIAPEEDPDYSFDETGETVKKIESGEWQCFMSRMRIVHLPTGADLAEAHLGNSIYANPAEFRDHIGARGKYGSYFRDMVSTCVSEARKTAKTMREITLRD
jgi:hypothetical protein